MKLNEHFDLREFVPPEIWKAYAENSVWFIDPRTVAIATAYREHFKCPIIINNWHTGGSLTMRGYRPPDAKTGARLSQHRFGRAFDCHFIGVTAQDVFREIVANFAKFHAVGLTTLEDVAHTPTWLHSDCRATQKNEPLIVRP